MQSKRDCSKEMTDVSMRKLGFEFAPVALFGVLVGIHEKVENGDGEGNRG